MENTLQLKSACEINAQEQELGQQQQQQQIEFTCEICIEPTPTARTFNNNNLCTHLFCVECIAKYIQVKILENTAQISCPGLNCQHNIDPISSNTMSLISKPMFSKWCELLCQDSVLTLQKSYCPNRECMEMVVNECTNINNIVKKSKCPNCNEFFCFECKKKWHAGFRCEDNEELTRNRNGILLGMLIESEKWQRCPTCGHCVQRSEGCRIIKCRCNTTFCYNCGKNMQEHIICTPAAPAAADNRLLRIDDDLLPQYYDLLLQIDDDILQIQVDHDDLLMQINDDILQIQVENLQIADDNRQIADDLRQIADDHLRIADDQLQMQVRLQQIQVAVDNLRLRMEVGGPTPPVVLRIERGFTTPGADNLEVGEPTSPGILQIERGISYWVDMSYWVGAGVIMWLICLSPAIVGYIFSR
ncbi:hypothetical protein ACFE04_024277 [Oxalis oulophora]